MHRIEVLTRTPELDRHGERLAKQIRSELGLEVEQMRVGKVYYLSESLDPAEAERVASDLLIDPIVEQATLGTVSLPGFDWSIEVGYRPGVTDNEARTAEQTIEFARRAGRVHADGPVQVHTPAATSWPVRSKVTNSSAWPTSSSPMPSCSASV